MKPTDIIRATDRYLDLKGHTDEAYAHTIQVMEKYEWMIHLATERALDELLMPHIVTQPGPPTSESIPPTHT